MNETLRVDLRIVGPKDDKGYTNQVASFDLPCDANDAWEVYRFVVARLTTPVITATVLTGA